MSEEVLKDYLRKQARSLDSLLELTPAKYMFGDDVSDQWIRKKQTAEQKKAARMAKLDPANWKSAKDVYNERSAEAAKKRKREDDVSTGSGEPTSMAKKLRKTDAAKPTEKIGEREPKTIENLNLKKRAKKRAHKKERNAQRRALSEGRVGDESQIAGEGSNLTDEEEETPRKEPSLPPKPQHPKKEKTPLKKGHDGAVKSTNTPQSVTQTPSTELGNHSYNEQENKPDGSEHEAWSDVEDDIAEHDENGENDENDDNDDRDAETTVTSDESDSADETMHDQESSVASSEGVPDILSPPHESAASSVSSILPPQKSSDGKPDSRKQTKIHKSDSAETIPSDADRQAARKRLQEQIANFRSLRKADDKPVRSRAELLEQRRQKEQERKVAKKEQRKKEKEEEAKRQDEEMARRFSPGGSGSLLASPRSPMLEDDGNGAFSFGRIAFEDGTSFDPLTGSASAPKKSKGASDPTSALKAAQAKQARISGLDDQKRQDIQEKDMWLNAKKRAHGERVKDDTSLLKKALKRQEKHKHQSEQDWNKRVEGVRSSQEAAQKKRAGNIQKRKDENLARKGGKKPIKKPRAGFEGSFRGRTSKNKKQ